MALTGFLFNNVCFSDINTAYADFVYSLPIPLTTPTSFTSLNYLPPPQGTWIGLTGHFYFTFFDVIGNVKTLNHNLYIESISFKPCDPALGFNNGFTYGMAIVGVMVIGLAWRLMRKAAE